MNPLIKLKKTAPLLLISLTLHCFALLPQAPAVVPPPDGGYPGFNTAEGHNALLNLSTGSANTAVGWFSLSLDATGSFNTATGAGSLLFNTGDANTAFGAAALLSNGTGGSNTAVGAAALSNNLVGVSNTAVGASALANNFGSGNTAIGRSALVENDTGGNNIAIGFLALPNNTVGSFNIALGTDAGSNVTTANNVICIGDEGANVSTSCFIGNIYGSVIDPGTTLAVGMDASHRLGTAVSSQRFKRDIQPMENASEAILALKPMKFHYKSDVKSIPCFGLVAEDVEKVNPDLVVRDKNGEPLSVRYEQINAMLLNEFLKEHKRVEELNSKLAEHERVITRQQKEFQTTVARQDNEIRALIATAKEQAAQIQKVSAQVELSKAPLLTAESP